MNTNAQAIFSEHSKNYFNFCLCFTIATTVQPVTGKAQAIPKHLLFIPVVGVTTCWLAKVETDNCYVYTS